MKLLEKPKFTTAHSRAGTKRALLGCAGHLLGGFVLSVGAVARQIMRWCWARAFWPVAADISSSAQSTAIIAVCGARLRLPATWYACSLVVRCC